MHDTAHKRPGGGFGRWLNSLGMSVRLFFTTLSAKSIRSLSWDEFRYHCRWMGEGSIPLVILSAVFISLALTSQAVLELQRFGAEDLAGPLITLGLLRELGPLTVSVMWCCRVAAFISAEACTSPVDEKHYAEGFMLPRYLAALYCAVPLSVLGLVAGFCSAALYAPMLGVSSTTDFVEGARSTIRDKDVFVFFFKLLFVNPTIGVFVGCAAGRSHHTTPAFAVADAVMTVAVICAIANLAVSLAAYMQ